MQPQKAEPEPTRSSLSEVTKFKGTKSEETPPQLKQNEGNKSLTNTPPTKVVTDSALTNGHFTPPQNVPNTPKLPSKEEVTKPQEQQKTTVVQPRSAKGIVGVKKIEQSENERKVLLHQDESNIPQETDQSDAVIQQPIDAQPTSKSWASLFAGKVGSEVGPELSQNKPMAVISPYIESNQPVSSLPSHNNAENGDIDKSLGAFLRDYPLKHCSTALVPRGLTNRSNWCFVNAILQALLACPALYNLIRCLAINPALATSSGRKNTPMLDSVCKFMSEFTVLEPVSGTRSQKKDKNKRRNDINTGVGLEPSSIFNMLLGLPEDTFKVVEGRQEDAEEFLSCLLNGLSDEMQELIKLSEEPEDELNEEEDGDEDDWQEVGAKGRSCVTRRVAGSALPATPVQALALGMCRSCVKVEGKDSSCTLQPFYTLQLDIQDKDIQSVTDALQTNFANEKLDGFVCGKTKQEVEATRSLSLEELPPVLILHLKRFVYDGATGGVQKIMKPVNFSVDLEISKSVLSAECRAATTAKHRQYKLFSVVCHNGREATKGHYVTDVFHTGYSTWLHCDDGIVQPTAEELVVDPGSNSTPYILFYRRGDTMVGMERREQ